MTSPLKRSLLCKSAIAAVALFASSAALADSISPVSFEDTIQLGESTSVTKTVTISQEASTSKLDIFFLADTTGSMGSAIASAKATSTSLMSNSALLGDVNWAVGEYKDQSDAFAYRLNQDFTSTQSAVTTGINQWGASGGGDFPEANLYALEEATQASWRTGSGRVLVWFGDAPGHDPRLGSTETSATNALAAKNIKVQAINTGNLDSSGQATRIAAATDGGVFGSSGAGVGAAIAAAITEAVTNYNSVCLDTSETPAGLGVASTGCYVGDYDRSVERTFEFELTFTGEAPGEYSFNTYAAVDGGHVATEADRITVTAVPEAETYAMLLAGLGLLGFVARRQKTLS